MPIALEPSETFAVVLASDQAKPPTEQPRFVFRHLTHRERKRLDALCDRDIESFRGLPPETFDTHMDEIWGLVNSKLVGWEAMRRDGKDVPFEAGGLDLVLSDREIWEVAAALRIGTSLGGAEKNASESPAPGNPGPSAGPAAPQAETRADGA
jgi:hypothetical protein